MSSGGSLAVIVVSLIALAIGGWTFAVGRWLPAETTDGPVVIESDSGEASLFVREVVHHRDLSASDALDRVTTRLAIYDLETGTLRARRVIRWFARSDLSWMLPGPSPGGVWSVSASSEGIQVLDIEDGHVLMDPSDLMSESVATRLLRTGPLPDRAVHVGEDRALLVQLQDGTWARLSGERGGSAPFAGQPPPRPRASSGDARSLGGGRWALLRRAEGEPPQTSRLSLASKPGVGLVVEGAPGEVPFLAASLVQGPGGRAMLLDDPPSLLVAHADTIEADAPRRLSRVRVADGAPLWTALLGPSARIELAHGGDAQIVLVLRSVDGTTLVAFDRSDGEERYRVALD